MIKVVLVDDQASVRQGLRMLLGLEPDVTVVGEAGDGATALELVPVLAPDVVVMDVEMPGMDGISATTALRAIAPHSAVVVLTLHDDSTTRSRVRAAGARAFVSKHEATEALTPAIRHAAASTAA
jgi:DNA-binding NarL/FixJ family response regulator